MVSVTLENVRKHFGNLEVLKDINLEIPDQAFVALVGPSGCGKSTLLRVIAGLEAVDCGTIRFGDRKMNEVPAPERGAAMVFQSYALYPHMTVWENISFSLRLMGVGRQLRRQQAARVAKMLQLEALLDRKPGQLSGGQRQRVAIGRALMREPDVYLFDEPLSNLDAALRAEMRVELKRLHRSIGNTMIYVTHDQIEAMTMANQIVVINEGQVMQTGAPMELYTSPQSLFVAEFIGSPKINLIAAEVSHVGPRETILQLDGGYALNLPAYDVGEGASVTIGIRPEAFSIAKQAAPAKTGTLPAIVDIVEHLGAEALIYCRLEPRREPIRATDNGSTTLKPGDPIWLVPDATDCHLFSHAGWRIERVETGTATGHTLEGK